MKHLTLIAAVLFLAACSSKGTKSDAATDTAAAKAAEAKADARAATASGAAKGEKAAKRAADEAKGEVSGRASCKAGAETRLIEIVSRGTGCAVEYTKQNEKSEIASAAHETQHCTAVLERVKGKLEAAGFSCE